MRGTAAREARRKTAIERLEKHLQDHGQNHVPTTDKEKEKFRLRFPEQKDFMAHDKAQKAELARIKLL